MAAHGAVLALFSAVVCGDDAGVSAGKPAPDIYQEAARQLGVACGDALAIEDAPSGIEAALKAGMRVVAVPSIVNCAAYDPFKSAERCVFLKSLLDFDPPAQTGTPPCTDVVEGTIPLEHVWRLKGPVVKGFGRGSKELGIPTANLHPDSGREAVAEAVTGIYCGYASVGSRPGVHRMVMSVGWNPFFSNEEKTFEPWLLEDFAEDFYGEELRLLVCAYLRPEADFVSLECLRDQILHDAEVTKQTLAHPLFDKLAKDPFLRPPSASAVLSGSVQ